MNQYVPIFFELYSLLKTPYSKSQIAYQVFLTESLDNIFKALIMIAKHQNHTKVKYKVIFTFGDIIQLDWKIQNALYKKCISLNLAFGMTVKLQEKNFKYLTTLQKICSIYQNKEAKISMPEDKDELLPEYLQNKKNSHQKESIEFSPISFIHYLDVLLLKDNKNVFTHTNYIKNIQTLIKVAHQYNHEFEFFIYINKQVLLKYSAKELKDMSTSILGNIKVRLEFDPNISIIKQQLHYPFTNIFQYITEFYNFDEIESYHEKFKHNFIYLTQEKNEQNLSELQIQENTQELEEILNANSKKIKSHHIKNEITSSDYKTLIKSNFFDFIETKFSIDVDLNVYYSFESVYGNLSLFQNDIQYNKTILGNLKKKPLDVILTKEFFIKEEMINKFHLEQSIFGCQKCIYHDTCLTNAIGLLRRDYPDFEKKAGHCFGIKNF